MDLELNDKRALVTGASRGIGRTIAETLHAEGCRIAINGRTREDLDATAVDETAREYPHAMDLPVPEN